jgi:hypothetical protein
MTERRRGERLLVPPDLINIAEANAEVAGRDIATAVEGNWFVLSVEGDEWEIERSENGGTVLKKGDESLDIGRMIPDKILEKGTKIGIKILVEARVYSAQDTKSPQP